MSLVQVAFQLDQLVRTVASEVHHMWAELCDSLLKVRSRRGQPYLELDEVTVQSSFHSLADTGVLACNAQVALG
ncbi:hypothetical protein OG563_18370 [Nocardia vinacea]|uniref:Uncharacterized protein n=1 Tax=Nocardia vinacea TaxID=96468 RepID=A0ABZ1Z345_9NOCA|nr:hypothetical protein [Nocardia vinacea]